MVQDNYTIDDLLTIMDRLRDPETGCPWDLQQSFESIIKYTLEEVYEVVDAIEQKDFAALKEELGDLLFHVVYYSKLGKEQKMFEFYDIVDQICNKMIRRHPHVFTELKVEGETEVRQNWEQEKARERQQKVADGTLASALDNIPMAHPALLRATKMQQRAAAVNFDFGSVGPVVSKVYEELGEVEYEVKQVVVDEDKLEEELGDLFFSAVNLARHLNKDPEQALRKANQKFERRFRQVEQLALIEGKDLADCSADEMEQFWIKVKENYNI